MNLAFGLSNYQEICCNSPIAEASYACSIILNPKSRQYADTFGGQNFVFHSEMSD